MLPSNSVASCSWHLCYHYPIPTLLHSSSSSSPHKYNNLLLFLPHKRTITASSPSKFYTHFTKNHCFLTLTATNNCSKEQKKKKKKKDSHPTQNHASLEHLYSSIHTNKRTQFIRNQEANEETSGEFDNREAISTNMWWADLKAALGQRINLEGIVSSLATVARDRHLALPHISVPDIRYLDWAELKAKGFQGVVFDKDNTVTVPYSLTLWPPLGSSLERCKLVFGNEIAVFSNSAGLHEYDSDGLKARALESAIGIKVIRHRVKKPAGTAEEIEKHFGCESSQLIMVGDRPFTDIVYGNRNGFLTVLTEPLSLAEEPFIVKQVRKLEVALVKRWSRKGLKSTSHRLLPDVLQCVRDPPHL